MKQYWPTAITTDEQKLFTTTAALSEKECMFQFDIWQNHYGYEIDRAWIRCGDADKMVIVNRQIVS